VSIFFRIYFSAFVHPEKAFDQLLNHKKYFQYGFAYMLIPIVGNTLMYIFLTIGHGAPSVFTPWLNIPKEIYYSVNRFLLAPGMLLAWFACASVIQVFGRTKKGNGSFEQILSVTGLSISVAMWGSLLHDLPMSILSATHIIDTHQHEIDMNSPTIWRTILWIFYSVYLIAFLILFSKSVKVVHNIKVWPAIIIGSLGFIVFQLVFLIFNR
jgi:hypothetical protein